jgi:hypothetical protein
MKGPTMKLHDMKRTAKDKKEEERSMQAESPMDSDYHYGLRIHAGGPELEKMGIKDNPEPGKVYHIEGKAKVVHSHQSMDEKGAHRHVEFHFHEMGAEPEEEEEEKPKSLRKEIEDNTAASDLKREGATKKAEEKKNAGKKDDEGEDY